MSLSQVIGRLMGTPQARPYKIPHTYWKISKEEFEQRVNELKERYPDTPVSTSCIVDERLVDFDYETGTRLLVYKGADIRRTKNPEGKMSTTVDFNVGIRGVWIRDSRDEDGKRIGLFQPVSKGEEKKAIDAVMEAHPEWKSLRVSFV